MGEDLVMCAECDIIGLTSGEQLVYFAAQADLDDCLSFSKAMLKRYLKC